MAAQDEGPSTWALLGRAVGMLMRASPLGFGLVLATALLQGIAPNIITLAVARVIGIAPRLGHSAPARAAAVTALAGLTGALLAERIAASIAPVSTAYLTYRFTAGLDRIRLRACLRLPGLEHFESHEQSDRLKAVAWSKSAPPMLLDRLVTLVRRATMLIGALVILLRLGWWVPALLCGSAIVTGVNDWRHAGTRTRLQRGRTAQLRFADYHRDLAVNAAHAREVRLLDLGEWLARRQEGLWHDGMAAVFANLRRQLKENTAINLLRAVVLTVPLIVALVELRRGELSIQAFSASVFALRTAANGMYVLEGVPGGLRETIAFLPEVIALDELPEVDPRLTPGAGVRMPRRLQHGIRFEGVVFTYPGQSEPVLDGLDLEIRPGESVALVGENGAGKSTLVKLLCRLYDPVEGRITLDGRDLRDFDLLDLRQHLAVVPQNFVRLPTTAWENVSVAAPGADPAALLAAADLAGAGPVVERLPAGWDTVLSREFGGIELSGGQWQRLALTRLVAARAVRQTPILVLDEPTSALDVRIEAELYEQFEGLTRDSTTLLISHRFSTVRMASRVAVLEHGRILESDTHRALMAAGGRYAELFALQARRFGSAAMA